MSQQQPPISKPKDCWCGWKLSLHQQQTLTTLTMLEFEKSPKKRLSATDLIKIVTGDRYFKTRALYENKHLKK